MSAIHRTPEGPENRFQSVGVVGLGHTSAAMTLDMTFIVGLYVFPLGVELLGSGRRRR